MQRKTSTDYCVKIILITCIRFAKKLQQFLWVITQYLSTFYCRTMHCYKNYIEHSAMV